MKKTKKILIIIITIVILIIVGLLIYFLGFKQKQIKQESEIDKVIKENKLLDTVGEYKIYGKTKDGMHYLIKGDTIISSGQGWINILDNLDENKDCYEEERKTFVGIDFLDKCKFYTIDFGSDSNQIYLINKDKNTLSGSYTKFDSSFDDDYMYLFTKGYSLYGSIDIRTLEEKEFTSFDRIKPINNNNIIALIDGKVGLFNVLGETILEPEYDYIGVMFQDDNYLITIKDGNVKIYDDDMNETKIRITDWHHLDGIYYNDKMTEEERNKYFLFEVKYKVDVNSNTYFKYSGKDITGRQKIFILKYKCPYSAYDNDEMVVYVEQNGTLVKLNSTLLEPSTRCAKY